MTLNNTCLKAEPVFTYSYFAPLIKKQAYYGRHENIMKVFS